MGGTLADVTARVPAARRLFGRKSPPERVVAPDHGALLLDRERLQALHDVSRVFAAEVADLPALLRAIARRASQLLGDMCLVTLLADDGRTLEIAAIDHREDSLLAAATAELFAARPYPSDRGPAGRVIANRVPVRMTIPEPGGADVPGLAEADLAYLRRFGVRSWLIVPLQVRGRALGTLGLWRGAGGGGYSEADQDFLEQLGDLAALALSNARLLADANRRADRLRSLYLSEMASITGPSLRHTLAALLDQLTRRPEIDAALVFLRDGDAGLRVAAAAGAEVAAGHDWRLGAHDSALARSMAAGTPIRVDDATGPPLSSIRLQGDRAPAVAYVAPVVSPAGVEGALLVLAAGRGMLDDEFEQFADTIAARAGAAVDRLRLDAEVKRLRASAGVARDAGPTPRLSRSEAAILPRLAAGQTNDQIARAVHLSGNTVKFHVSHILRKLGARNRVEAARAAIQLGMLE